MSVAANGAAAAEFGLHVLTSDFWPLPMHVPIETWRLPNGLFVTLSEDHTTPIVAVNLWYHVGSANERAGRTGFAHLFEHMLFQGSAHVEAN